MDEEVSCDTVAMEKSRDNGTITGLYTILSYW